MTTTTAEQTVEEPQLSQPRAGIEFVSRRAELRLTKTPRYPVMGASGQKVSETHGEVVAFRDGRFFCPTEGTVTLEDGRSADAAEIMAFLEAHRLNGNLYEGFGPTVTPAPAPTAVDIDAIVQAAEKYDVARLEELIALEEGGWNRDAILTVARASLARVREANAAIETAEREQQERARIEAENAAKVAAAPSPPAERAEPAPPEQ